MADLDENYWSERYRNASTGWDIGFPSPPIVQYLDQIENKEVEILIPGAGNSYEAAYAFNKGFSKINVLDLSREPLNNFKKVNPDFPDPQLHHEDFFLHMHQYDLILEQTFFCAINPSLREKYVAKMHELLKPGGKLVGVLFNRHFDFQGPPFGGDKEEYQTLFSKKFKVECLETCYNSIPQRQNSEVFIMMKKSNA